MADLTNAQKKEAHQLVDIHRRAEHVYGTVNINRGKIFQIGNGTRQFDHLMRFHQNKCIVPLLSDVYKRQHIHLHMHIISDIILLPFSGKIAVLIPGSPFCFFCFLKIQSSCCSDPCALYLPFTLTIIARVFKMCRCV